MKLIKPQKSIDSDWLWEYEGENREFNMFDPVGETTLLFGVFYIDKYLKTQEIQLKDLLKRLENHIEEWNENYPWSDYNKISICLHPSINDDSIIMGQLTVEDHVREEEGLVLSLLQEFSRKMGSQVFIKICDTDGDFILAEASDGLPEEYEYPVANNRLWLHEGFFKMIPVSFHPEKGLTPQEALVFLRDEYFKLLHLKELTSSISNRVTKNSTEDFLANLVRLPLVIEDVKYFEILQSNPQIISLLIRGLMKQDITISCSPSTGESRQLDMVTPQRHCEMLSLYLQEKNLGENHKLIPVFTGRALCEVLKLLLKSQEVILDEKADAKHLGYSDNFKCENFAYTDLSAKNFPKESYEYTEDLLDKLGSLFNSDMKQEDNLKYERSDSDEDAKCDDACRKYFEKEQVDIDEDDFFEFILRDALKMNKEDIENMRGDYVSSTSDKEFDPMTQDIEDNYDIANLGELLNGKTSHNDSLQALHNLVESLTIDGASDSSKTIPHELGDDV